MNREDLINVLECNKVSKTLYGFGDNYGVCDDQFLLNKESNHYVIYYLERGRKNKIKSFHSEEKANKYFLELLLSYKG